MVSGFRSLRFTCVFSLFSCKTDRQNDYRISLFFPVALSCKHRLSLFLKLLCGTLVLYLYICLCDVIFLFLRVDELADSVSTEQEPAPSSVKELLNRLSCCRPLPQLFSPSFSSLHAVKLLVNEIVTIVVSVYALVLHVHMYMYVMQFHLHH